MNINNLKPPEAQINPKINTSPPLQLSLLRPYQAYCVTEASSRPSSPETPIPQPLHTQLSSAQESDFELSFLLDDPLGRLPTCTEPLGHLGISLKRELDCNPERKSSNARMPSGNTVLVNINHITPAVSPRESHPLVGNLTPWYDRTLSQSRMQLSTPSYEARLEACQSNPSPWHAIDEQTEFHPLPPLPVGYTEAIDCMICPVQLEKTTLLEEHTASTLQEPQRSFQSSQSHESIERFATVDTCEEDLQLPPEATTDIKNHPQSLKEIATVQKHSCSSKVRVRNGNVFFRDSSGDPRKGGILHDHAQVPSAKELYVPRGVTENMNVNQRAYRRTQPKDQKLKYQFGQRPPVQLSMPQPLPLHWHSPKSTTQPHSYDITGQQATNECSGRSLSPLSCNFYNNSQAGPRPPPWISYNHLEMQHRIRMEVRELEQARQYRMIPDTASSSLLHKDLRMTNSFGQSSMQREVNDYREQVLRVYPDMEFDVSAQKDGRGCFYFCIVM